MFVSDIDSFNKLKIKYKDIYLLLKKTSVRGNIVVMSAKEIEEKELLKCIDRSMKIVTKGTCIPVNGFVKILSGPFAGYEAKVKASSENKLVVEVMLFKRPVNLDLYVENVEVID
jgi:transcription antitermination factor NusG